MSFYLIYPPRKRVRARPGVSPSSKCITVAIAYPLDGLLCSEEAHDLSERSSVTEGIRGHMRMYTSLLIDWIVIRRAVAVPPTYRGGGFTSVHFGSSMMLIFRGSGPARAVSGNVPQTPKSEDVFPSHQGVML
eukprot:6388123-Prymnesium_polylepis.1